MIAARAAAVVDINLQPQIPKLGMRGQSREQGIRLGVAGSAEALGSAHHVQVHHRHQARHLRIVGAHVLTRANQAQLLRREQHDAYRPPRTPRRVGQRLDRRHQRQHSGAVVYGAVADIPGIEVRPQQKDLARRARIATAQLGHHVGRGSRPRFRHHVEVQPQRPGGDLPAKPQAIFVRQGEQRQRRRGLADRGDAGLG